MSETKQDGNTTRYLSGEQLEKLLHIQNKVNEMQQYINEHPDSQEPEQKPEVNPDVDSEQDPETPSEQEGINPHGERTVFSFDSSPDESWSIEGVFNRNKLIDIGYIHAENVLSGITYHWSKFPTGLSVGNAVTSIEWYTFYGDGNSLRSIEMAESIYDVDESAFVGCDYIRSPIYSFSKSVLFKVFPAVLKYVVPDTVTRIGQAAFAYQGNLSAVTIPASVTEIGIKAFKNCPNLSSVTFEGKTVSEVQRMSNYPWDIHTGTVIVCEGDGQTIVVI